MVPTTTNPTTIVSFARIVQQRQFPTKEQAIVMDSVEGHTVQEYTVALGNLINPRNIRYVSRISHGRICFYLNSKDIVDQLTDNNTKINIGNNTFEIRPLISKAKRIIISNVCPIISHTTIEEELKKKIGITPVSQITSIRAGISIPEYGHILSFCRQMYVHPKDVQKIPENMQINYDDTTYWIYLSAEKLTCFLCKEERHLAKYCKNTESNLQNSYHTNANKEQTTNETSVSNQLQETNNLLIPKESDFLSTAGHKRPLSSVVSTSSNQSDSKNINTQNDINDRIWRTGKKN
ncbi:Transposon TX1 uncharacterized 82 kDa protein [Formica fusca]